MTQSNDLYHAILIAEAGTASAATAAPIAPAIASVGLQTRVKVLIGGAPLRTQNATDIVAIGYKANTNGAVSQVSDLLAEAGDNKRPQQLDELSIMS